MEYSSNYKATLARVFISPANPAFLPARYEWEIPIEHFANTGKLGNIVVDYAKTKIIPTIALPFFMNRKVTHKLENTLVVINLFTTVTNPEKKRTADAIITTFATHRIICEGHLIPVEAGNGELFYGNAGIILDSSGKILMMNALEYDKGADIFTKAVICVNPCVLNKSNLIEKSILGKVLPFYINYCKEVTIFSDSYGNAQSVPVEIVFKDMSHIISYPKKPSITANEELNDYLIANSKDVIKCLNAD